MFNSNRKDLPIKETVIAVLIFLFTSSGIITLKIAGAMPFLLLPFAICVAMYKGEVIGLFFGFFCGILADIGFVNDTVFNTVFLSITGFLVAVAVKYFFNRNLPALIVMTIIISFLYYGIKWLFGCYFPDVQGKIYYLLNISLPSAFYTSFFSLPFYFLEKYLTKNKNKKSEIKSE